MNSKAKDDELRNNPFVALFPNIEQARQYVEATQKGLEESRKLLTESKTDETKSNGCSVKDKLPSASKSTKKSINQSKDIIINDYLQRIFLITVNSDESNLGATQFGGLPQRCIFLEELSKELKESKVSLFLNVDNLNQAVLERLQLAEPVLHLCIQSNHRDKALNAVMLAREELLIKYLSECHGRLVDEEVTLKRKTAKDKSFAEEINNISNECRRLILSFSGSILQQPDIFPTNNPYHQLLNVMKNSGNEPLLLTYILNLLDVHPNLEDVHTMFTPVLDLIWEETLTIELLQPKVLGLLNAMVVFSKSAVLTSILLKSRYWLPQDLQDGHEGSNFVEGATFEQQTILGRFMGLSSMPHDLSLVPDYFLAPSRQSEAEMYAITENIRFQIDAVVSKLHEMLYNIVQKPEAQHKVLYWIGMCLFSNNKRTQMVCDPRIVASCGFFLNLTNVLLKFCEPFLGPMSNLLIKVDCRYGASSVTAEDIKNPKTLLHTIGLDKLTPMVNKPNHIPPVNPSQGKSKFVTEIFYLTQVCFKLGILKSYESYQELMKKLQKMSTLYQDARFQGTGDSMVEALKNQFESEMRKQLAIKAHLIHPNLSDLALKFCVASSYWLVQQTLAYGDYSKCQHRELKLKSLEDEVAPALTVIPEFFAENIGDTVRMMGYGHLPYVYISFGPMAFKVVPREC